MWMLIIIVILLLIIPPDKSKRKKHKQNSFFNPESFYDDIDEPFDDGEKDLDFSKEDDKYFDSLFNDNNKFDDF